MTIVSVYGQIIPFGKDEMAKPFVQCFGVLPRRLCTGADTQVRPNVGAFGTLGRISFLSIRFIRSVR